MKRSLILDVNFWFLTNDFNVIGEVDRAQTVPHDTGVKSRVHLL